MASRAPDRQAGSGDDDRSRDLVEQIPEEAWDEFVAVLRERLREAQASEETRREFVNMLLDKLRADPYPSREQLDMIEESLPPDMVAEYARALIEKAEGDPFPSKEMLQRIRAMTGSA